MTTKATFHQIIEELPESELVAAGWFLSYLRDMADRVCRALLTAPWDDEPETEDERQAVQEARNELARGEVYPLDRGTAGAGLVSWTVILTEEDGKPLDAAR